MFFTLSKRDYEKVYNNIINSINVYYKTDRVFMNYENSKTSGPHRLWLNFSDRINLKKSEKTWGFIKP